MLHHPIPLERRCPRRWSLAAACGLLSLSVLAAGVTVKAATPAPEPKKEKPKAEAPAQPPAVPDLPLPDIDDLLKRMPNLDADQAARLREQMRQTRERLRKLLEQQRNGGLNLGFIDPANPLFPGASQPQEGRLGVQVEKPSETLIEQLELPKGQGLIIREVTPDTAAAKAGLKAHEILLEVDGMAVASDPGEFRKTLDGVKSDTPVDVVVLRKGKKETIKGLTLPEAKTGASTVPGVLPVAPPVFGTNFPPAGLNPTPAAGNGVVTTTVRTNDHFTTRHQEGGLVITLTGKVEDGKATANEISVQDGAETSKYDSVEKAPENYRDKIKNLLEMTEKGSVKVDVKVP